MSNCTSVMVPQIQQSMINFMQDVYARTGTQMPPMAKAPFWLKSSLRQHAEYAANDYCAARGLQGLGALERPTFPSVQAVYDLKDGKQGAFADVAKWTAIRAALIGAGLFIGGDRSFKSIAIKSVIASVLVEGAVIAYIEVQERKAKAKTGA